MAIGSGSSTATATVTATATATATATQTRPKKATYMGRLIQWMTPNKAQNWANILKTGASQTTPPAAAVTSEKPRGTSPIEPPAIPEPPGLATPLVESSPEQIAAKDGPQDVETKTTPQEPLASEPKLAAAAVTSEEPTGTSPIASPSIQDPTCSQAPLVESSAEKTTDKDELQDVETKSNPQETAENETKLAPAAANVEEKGVRWFTRMVKNSTPPNRYNTPDIPESVRSEVSKRYDELRQYRAEDGLPIFPQSLIDYFFKTHEQNKDSGHEIDEYLIVSYFKELQIYYSKKYSTLSWIDSKPACPPMIDAKKTDRAIDPDKLTLSEYLLYEVYRADKAYYDEVSDSTPYIGDLKDRKVGQQPKEQKTESKPEASYQVDLDADRKNEKRHKRRWQLGG